jgi:thiamine biosynthesis lipoprotein
MRNNNRNKNAIYSLVLLLAVIGTFLYRKYTEPTPVKPDNGVLIEKIKLSGKTMGTYYTIAYFDSLNRNLQKEIDSVLVDYNNSLSTYIPTSEISRFNKQDSVKFSYSYFYPVMKRSEEIYKITEGAFNPTVMPLVNAWGFGPERKSEVPQSLVDSLLDLVSFESLEYNESGILKTKKGVSLDFSAIAKGNGIDVVANYLKTQNIRNYMVLIGGEANCLGGNEDGKGWVIGIDNPKFAEEGGEEGVGYFAMKGKSVATSGNYRRFYMKDGKKYAHTIDPKTGYPVAHSLLSATVFAPDCTTSDAYATAFMVVGLEKAKELVAKDNSLEAFFVYDSAGEMKTFTTEKAQAWQLK